MHVHCVSKKVDPVNKLLYLNKNVTDLSEILRMQTLKHVNKNVHIVLRKHRTTSVLLTFKYMTENVPCLDKSMSLLTALNK